MFARVSLAILVTLLVAGAAQSADAPKLSITKLKTPLPYPYDEHADAMRDVAAAKARATAEGKLLLIDLGGNWCPDCRILAGTMDLPELRAFVAAHYVTVMVDVGRLSRNLQIPAHYGMRDRLIGVPTVLIVDPRTDRLLDSGHTAALADARTMRWRRKFGQAAKVGSTSLKDGLYDWEAEAVLG
jgi:thiol-disulfide isomerase/thioredoxin